MDETPEKACRNGCGRLGLHSRGLCKPCFSLPSVRDKFPPRPTGASKAPPEKRCRNCTKRKAMNARGLCYLCCAIPAVRERFPLADSQVNAHPLGSPCRHCKKAPITRGRGLCWVCGRTPEIRALYAPVSKYGRQSVDRGGARPLPAHPTDARPGSEEKIRVMEARAARGEQLHHPQDRKVDLAAPISGVVLFATLHLDAA